MALPTAVPLDGRIDAAPSKKRRYDVLQLNLKKAPFDVMITGEKTIEYREKGRPSQWMERRLFNADGSFRTYQAVHFRNGFQKEARSFTAAFLGVTVGPVDVTFSNGLRVCSPECFHIHLGPPSASSIEKK